MRNRFHSLCPYFAMFPEDFVARWVKEYSRRGDLVMDPFCGRGTTPFQALLMGRRAVANDVNPVAYCISRAKMFPPSRASVLRRITQLRNSFDKTRSIAGLPAFFYVAYSRNTLRQILHLRENLRWQKSDVDCMISAVLLSVIHGEGHKTKTCLSNQMPRTISTKPQYSIKFWRDREMKAPMRDAFDILRDVVIYRYESELPQAKGDKIFLGDFRELWQRPFEAPSVVVTSPPYPDVTRYEEDQWLRLWFLGGPPKPAYGRLASDDRHENATSYWRFIGDFWRVMGRVCAKNAKIVMRIGAKGMEPSDIVSNIESMAQLSTRKVALLHMEQSEIRNRQTDAFRPGSQGIRIEVDCVFRIA